MCSEKVQSISTKDLAAELVRRCNDSVVELKRLVAKIAMLRQEQNRILDETNTSSRLLHDLAIDYPKIKIPKFVLPLELRFIVNPNLTIGDAMEMLLIEHGPMNKQEIIDALQKAEVRFSLNNAHTVVGTAVKRDGRSRFKRLNNGKIALENKRAIRLDSTGKIVS